MTAPAGRQSGGMGVGTWKKIEAGWYKADGIGSIRTNFKPPKSWWFFAEWLPDNSKSDFGPFRTKTQAIAEAKRLAESQALV